MLLIAFVLGTGRDQPFKERREEEGGQGTGKEGGRTADRLAPAPAAGQRRSSDHVRRRNAPQLPGRLVSRCAARHGKLNPGTVPTVLLVLGFCLMQQILLEVPLLGYIFAPESTEEKVTEFRSWMGRKGRSAAVIGASVIGAYLVARGVITLL